MKFYLAGKWASRVHLREEVRPFLVDLGHEVCSTWIDIPDGGGQAAIPEDDALALNEAWRDEEEVRACDAFLTVTYPDREGAGHLVEFGMAMVLGKLLMVAGPVKTVFHKRAHLIRPSWGEMRVALQHFRRQT